MNTFKYSNDLRLLLIIILTLSFQSWTKAEIAGEFEIQGLTLGDSLLKMYTEKEIKEYLSSNNSVNFYPSSKKYFTLTTFGKDKEFDQLNIDLKYNDTNYIIYGLSQYKRIKYKDCLNEQQTISENFENLFEKNTYQLDEYSNAHQGDPSGNSKYKSETKAVTAPGISPNGCILSINI